MARRILSIALVLALLPRPGAAAPNATPARKIKVAVMEIRPLGTEAHKAEMLGEVALTEAASFERFDIIGRSDIASMIGFEQQKKVLGCADDSGCLAEIGGALGVDYVLVGTLGRLGALYRVDLKLVDTRKARVLGRFGESVEGSEERLVAAVQKGIRQLMAPLTGELPIPVAKLPPPPAERKAAAPAPPVAPAAPATATAPAPAGSSRRFWGWTMTGGGAAVLGLGALTGLAAQKALDQEKQASAAGDAIAYQQYKDDAKKKAQAADLCFVVGGLSTGIGLYLLFTGAPAAVAVAPTDGGALAVVAGRF